VRPGGLAEKPVIDMVAGLRDLAESRAGFEPLDTGLRAGRRGARGRRADVRPQV